MSRPALQRFMSEEFTTPSTPIHVDYDVIHVHVDLHWHEFYEVGLITAGEGTHILNGVSFPVARGSVFLLTPADFHQLSPQPGSTLELFNVIFPDHVIADDVYHLLFSVPKEHTGVLAGRDYDTVARECALLWSEENERHLAYGRVMHGALERILILLARKLPTTTESIDRTYTGCDYHPVRQALIYIHHHFREPLTLGDVARQAGLSPNYFSECFHRATGSTFQSYLQELRLRFAMSLLSQSTLPVTTVCHASGFNTLSHFNRAFKRKFDRPPRRRGGALKS